VAQARIGRGERGEGFDYTQLAVERHTNCAIWIAKPSSLQLMIDNRLTVEAKRLIAEHPWSGRRCRLPSRQVDAQRIRRPARACHEQIA